MEYIIGIAVFLLVVLFVYLKDKIEKLESRIEYKNYAIEKLEEDKKKLEEDKKELEADKEELRKELISKIGANLDRYEDKVKYSEVLDMIRLRIDGLHLYNNDKIQQSAVKVIKKAIGVSKTTPKFILIGPTKCNSDIVEPIIYRIKYHGDVNDLTLIPKPGLSQ